MSIKLKLKKLSELFVFFRSKSSVKYFGYLGYDNLGDDILYVVINQLFGSNLAYKPKISNKFLSCEMDKKKFDLTILGGGTLICEELKFRGNKRTGVPFKNEFECSIQSSKNIVVFGTGVDEHEKGILVDNWLIEWKEILQRAKYVSCRGPRSKKILNHIGVTAEIIGDPALSLIKPLKYWKPEKKLMGINVRPYGYDLGVEKQYLETMQEFILNKINEGWAVEFIAVSEMDLQSIGVIIAGLQGYSPIVHKVYNNQEEYFTIVRRYQVFFGVRLHAVILSMCAGVPTVMINYRRKCDDFSESVLMEYLNVRIEEIDCIKLDKLLDIMLEDGESISKNIWTTFNKYKELQTLRAKELLENYS